MKKNILFFALGAVSGAIGSWLYLSYKYEQKLADKDEEIEAVKDRFDKRYQRLEETRKNAEKASIEEFASKYKEAVSAVKSYMGFEEETVKDPYVIPADDYGEFEDYDTLSYTYYSDGVLTDEMDEEIEDADSEVGEINDAMFDEYGDTIYIRNDLRKTDYEILRDEAAYSDFAENLRHPEWSVDDQSFGIIFRLALCPDR